MSARSDAPPPQPSGRRCAWRRDVRVWLLLAVAAYTLVGFLVLPWVAARQIVAFVGERLGRPATLERVRCNPYTFTLSLENFRAEEPDGTPLLTFGELFIDFEISSLVRPSWTFAEIRLGAPRINFVRFASGDNNLGRALAPLVGGEAPAEAGEGEPVALWVRRLVLEGGEVDVTDLTVPTRFTTHLGPIGFEVRDFGTLPDRIAEQRFELLTESGARVEWTGTVRMNPLRSAGHVSAEGEELRLLWRYLQDRLRFEITEGTTALGLDYDLELDSPGPKLEVRNLELTVENLAVRPKGEEVEVLRLPSLAVRGGGLDLARRAAHADEVRVRGVRLDTWRDAGGTLNVLGLLQAPGAETAAPPPAEEAPSPWAFTLDRLLVEDLDLAFEDRAMSPPLRTGVEDLRLEARKISTEPGASFDVDFATAVTTGGRLSASGKVGIDPLVVDSAVEIDGLSLVPLEPLLARVARLRLESANLSADGRVRSGGDESFAFEGNVALADLSAEDTLADERFVAWKALSLSGLAVRLDARSFEVPEVRIDAPYAKVFIAKDGSTNLGGVLAPNAGREGPSEAGAGEAEKAEPFAILIGKIDIAGGSANFADLSLPLPFETGIHSLDGEVTSLRTGSPAPARVKLHGTVSRYGEARIDGRLNAFQPLQDTDLRVAFRNLEMASLTPYSVKFAGYRIDEGKLAVELHYRLKGRRLEAGNRIVMDQLTLGERVESPDAIDVPLSLAIGLLKDANGRIDLDVPVSGSLDDPRFSYGKAIRDAIKTLLVRVVKAPFGFLGSLVGAGDDSLKYVLFDPGRDELGPPEREKLAKLAEALGRRPGLVLRVRGRWAKKIDGAALRMAKVNVLVDARLAEEGETGDEARREALEEFFRDEFSPTELENLEAAHTRVVEPAIRTGGGEPEPRLDEEAYLGALTTQLARRQPLDDAELRALGDRRARAIAGALAEGGTAAERVQLAESEETKKIVDGRVRVALGLKKE
jgi:hypothetical protein